MRAVLQRVTSAGVTIQGKETGKIGTGILVLLGIAGDDTRAQCDYLCDKIINLRIFEDEDGKLNRSLVDIKGELLLVSQFTLYGDCKKGRRPSFLQAARPETAIPLYEYMIERIRQTGIHVETGTFGADMLVSLKNDGPVTILLDTDEIMPPALKR